MKHNNGFTCPDLHIHTCYSDGTDTPLQLLEKIRKTDIDIFSITDHDDLDAAGPIRQLLKDGDPEFIEGVELSCRDVSGQSHILGYCYNVKKTSLTQAIEKTHTARLEKARNRLDYLENHFDMHFSESDRNDVLSVKNPGKPHIVKKMLQLGYIESRAQGFDLLNTYGGLEFRLTPEEAIRAIMDADGLPVLAHGILGDGTDNLSYNQIESRVRELKKEGLMGLECYYSGFTPDQQRIMLELSEKYNLFVTAGSDYHGSSKNVALGETNSPSPDKMERFYQAIQKVLKQ